MKSMPAALRPHLFLHTRTSLRVRRVKFVKLEHARGENESQHLSFRTFVLSNDDFEEASLRPQLLQDATLDDATWQACETSLVAKSRLFS